MMTKLFILVKLVGDFLYLIMSNILCMKMHNYVGNYTVHNEIYRNKYII